MLKIKYSNFQLWETLEQNVVTKICVVFPKANEVKQDQLKQSGDRRPSRAMSVAKGFKSSRSQKYPGVGGTDYRVQHK